MKSSHPRAVGAPVRIAPVFLLLLTLVVVLSSSVRAQSTPVASSGLPAFSEPLALPPMPNREEGPLVVVATTGIIADLVQQIGGTRVEIRTIIPANADPHEFEPVPKDVAILAHAQIVFVHGLGLDNWVETLIDNAGSGFSVVTVTDGIATVNRSGDNDHDHGVDPHVWFDPERTAQMAANIAAGLSAADPDAASAYTARLDVYQQSLAMLDREIAAQVALVPPDRRNIVTNHDALGYFADRYGFTIVGTVIPGLSPGIEPSAQNLAGLLRIMQEHHVTVIFAENTVEPKLARQLAADAGIIVVDTLYSDSLGDAGSGADTYIGLMQTDTRIIVTALLGLGE